MGKCSYIKNGKECKNKINYYNEYYKGYNITCYRHRTCLICDIKINRSDELCDEHNTILKEFITKHCKGVKTYTKIFENYGPERITDILNFIKGDSDISKVKDIIKGISHSLEIKNGLICISFD